jgi:hypothetical protein
MKEMRGGLSEAEMRFVQKTIRDREAMLLMEEAMKQARPVIRGMNSQRRIDMLKQPKFRR